MFVNAIIIRLSLAALSILTLTVIKTDRLLINLSESSFQVNSRRELKLK